MEGEGATLSASSDDDLSDHPPENFARVSLTILVLRAESLPEGDYLTHSRDPYVMVNVVDGDPLGEAASSEENWYTTRNKWGDKTAVNQGTDPQFMARLRTLEQGVLPREDTYIHFRVMDEDAAFQDTPIGQAVIPLSEVLRDAWHMPRALALVPIGQRTRRQEELQLEWSSLRKSRLHVQVRWEGVPSRVRSPVGWGDAGPAQPGRARSRRGQRDAGPKPPGRSPPGGRGAAGRSRRRDGATPPPPKAGEGSRRPKSRG